MPTPTIYDKFNKTGKVEDFPSYEVWKKAFHGPNNGTNYTYSAYERDKSRRVSQVKQQLLAKQEASKWDSLERRLGIPTNVDYYYGANTLKSSRNGTAPMPPNSQYPQPSVWYNGVVPNALTRNVQTTQDVIQARRNGIWNDRLVPEEDMATNPLENNSTVPSQKVKQTSNSNTQKAAIKVNQGDTVASIWTRVTGLPWKAAKELGLSDGSYAANIEILKGLKSGQITKESVAALQETQNATPYEPAPETYSMPAQPTIERPTLLINEPADTTSPSEKEMQIAAYGGWFY